MEDLPTRSCRLEGVDSGARKNNPKCLLSHEQKRKAVSFAEALLVGYVQEQTPRSHEIPASSNLLAPSFTPLRGFQKPWTLNGPSRPLTSASSFCCRENQSQRGRWLLCGHPSWGGGQSPLKTAVAVHTSCCGNTSLYPPPAGARSSPEPGLKVTGQTRGLAEIQRIPAVYAADSQLFRANSAGFSA